MTSTDWDLGAVAEYIQDSGFAGAVAVSGPEQTVDELQRLLPGRAVTLALKAGGEPSGVSFMVFIEPTVELIEQFSHATKVNPRTPILIILATPGTVEAFQDAVFTIGYQAVDRPASSGALRVFHHFSEGHKNNFDAADYWERRYLSGGHSGSGSNGRLAEFKAQFLNNFVSALGIKSVTELGCGDGLQLSLSRYPKYLGLDVSDEALRLCAERFDGDNTKTFKPYRADDFDPSDARSELALSLDVIFHLSSDAEYEQYLRNLFKSASRYVVIYANSETGGRPGFDLTAGYLRFRDFVQDISAWQLPWHLVATVPNRFPFSVSNPTETSVSDFYIFSQSLEESASVPPVLGLRDESVKKVSNKIETLIEDQGRGLQVTAQILSRLDQAQSQTVEELGLVRDAVHEFSRNISMEVRSISENTAELNEVLQLLQTRKTVDDERSLRLGLEAELEDVRRKHDQTLSRYRAANSRFRQLSRDYSLLRNSKSSRAARYLSRASRSPVEALKLPWRLLKLKLSPNRIVDKQAKKNPVSEWDRFDSVLQKSQWIVSKIGLIAKTIWRANEWPILGGRFDDSRSIQSVDIDDLLPKTSLALDADSQRIYSKDWPAPVGEGPAVLAVLDGFSTQSFRPHFRLTQPRPDNWLPLAERDRPEFVLVESAWKGNEGSWQYRVGSYQFSPGPELEQLMAWANHNQVPTVFWNKEDPVHYNKFIEAASRVDHVFTSDANMVSRYKRDTKAVSINVLPFAAEPSLHSPAPLDGRLNRLAFAGTWYGDRYPERARELEVLLSAAKPFGLDIFDRNFDSGAFSFPETYGMHVRGFLPYDELIAVQRRYRVFLNVNSVKNSPTMFSRRVFELLASGTPVISTPGDGMSQLLGENAVWVCRNKRDADDAVSRLMADDADWRKRSLHGIRTVLSRHTYAHRVAQICDTIGVQKAPKVAPWLLMIAESQGPEDDGAFERFVAAQTYRNFSMVVFGQTQPRVLHGPDLDASLMKQLLGRKIEEVALRGYLGVGRVCPGCHYGDHYLEDLVNASRVQPKADGWAKSTAGDLFDFGISWSRCSGVWSPSANLSRYLFNEVFDTAEVTGIFVVDSSEFSAHASLSPESADA